MKHKTKQMISTGLFIGSLIGVVVTAGVAAYDMYKAMKKVEEGIDIPTAVEVADGVKVASDTEYRKAVVKTVWPCFVPTAVATVTTIGLGVASKRIDGKTITGLMSVAAGGASLVQRYRHKFKEFTSEDILKKVDEAVAKEEIEKCNPPVVTTSGSTSYEELDLSDDGEYTFYDPFTKMKFRTTKLAVMGARYFLNRNFAIGGNVSLEMFYGFLGLELPEEYKYCEWDCQECADSGYFWIDIDIQQANEPDPDTGEKYYIIHYGFDPGECEENFYTYGNPIEEEGSYIA